jgi:hypothetical protein
MTERDEYLELCTLGNEILDYIWRVYPDDYCFDGIVEAGLIDNIYLVGGAARRQLTTDPNYIVKDWDVVIETTVCGVVHDFLKLHYSAGKRVCKKDFDVTLATPERFRRNVDFFLMDTIEDHLVKAPLASDGIAYDINNEIFLMTNEFRLYHYQQGHHNRLVDTNRVSIPSSFENFQTHARKHGIHSNVVSDSDLLAYYSLHQTHTQRENDGL